MALKLVLVAWTKPMLQTRAKPTDTAVQKQVTATARIYLPEAVISYFNIPVATDQSYTGPPVSEVKQHTRSIYKGGVGDTTATTITINPFERDVNTAREVVKKVARLKLIDKTIGDTKKLRTTSIRFPNYFNMIMITQAMGTMILAKNPGYFVMDGKGGKHGIVSSPGMTGAYPNYKSGAWVVTAPIAGVNTDTTSAQDQDQVPPPNDPKASP